MTTSSRTRRDFGRAAGFAAGAALATAAGVPGPSTAFGAPLAQTARAPLGTNLARIDEWSGEYPFVNAFRQSRQWFSGTWSQWEDGRALSLNSDGWVTSLQSGQLAKTTMYQGLGVHYPSGQYVVTFEGEGQIAYSDNAKVVQRSANRHVLDVDSARGGIGLIISSIGSATSPNNYIRNIVVTPPLPSTPAVGEIFHPTFLDRLKAYKAIRFTNWQSTNGQWRVGYGNPERVWSDRPTLNKAQWTQMHGVPLEVCCALANKLGTDGWFCVPHRAEDSYVQSLAQFLVQNLDPSLKIYIEYSNEVWNGNYDQAAYCRDQGVALNLSTTGDPFQAQQRYYAKRATEIFKLCEPIIPKDRLVRVLGTQTPWVSEQELGFQDTAAHVDALAMAPYFNFRPDEESTVPGMSLDQLFNAITTVLLPRVKQATQAQAPVATKYGLRLIAYEGGQHLVGLGPWATDSTVNNLFNAANRDPRMSTVYRQWLQDWTDSGGQLLMHFVNCGAYTTGPSGRFGSLEYMEQPRDQAPKYDALQRWMEGR